MDALRSLSFFSPWAEIRFISSTNEVPQKALNWLNRIET